MNRVNELNDLIAFLSRIKELLERFRVNFSDLVVITDLNKPPKESTRTWFDGLVRHFIRHEELNGNND